MKKARGLLIDTNLLVLLVIGSISEAAIAGNKRLSAYTTSDFRLLLSFVEQFSTLFTTPHILTEVSNLIGCETKQQRQGLEILKLLTQRMEELLPASNETMSSHSKSYLKFGLSDASIHRVAADNLFVLTDYLNFCYYLQGQNILALNFNNLRTDYLLH
ncbi:PIN domain-containing protein [Spirosoma luteolum]